MPKHPCQASRPNTFDLARSPLDGFNFIDASAGTGKTYTICGLVLRLLLEKDLPIEQILVVTYTEAATEDLRDRIRLKLHQALETISNPPGDDEFLQEYLADIKDSSQAALRISQALRSFDAAAIYTIHGFCQRMLLENSFESNSLFDTELIADDSHIIREIVEDFWRRNFSHSSMLFNQYCGARLTPASLYDFLTPLIPHPFLQFVPDIDFDSGCNHLSETEAAYVEAYITVCREWAAARDEVSADLLRSNVLSRTVYKKAAMPGIISAMDDMAAANLPAPCLFDRFAHLTCSKIISGTKTRETPNILPFYEHCENLMQAGSRLRALYDRCLLALKKNLLDRFRQELALRKARDNVFAFDDLLQRVHDALSGPDGIMLARTVVRKYPAALIDEFQDTDPRQFEIFRAIYREGSLLFLIGDPKQAIYSFRGADIFTYMDAAADSPVAHHTLGVNHRSAPALVKAVNTLFSRARKPFVFDAISFQPVSAAFKQNPDQLTIDGREEEPFILWFLARSSGPEDSSPSSRGDNPRLSKTAARSRIMSRVGAEITRLLSLALENRVCISGRRLLPGDIAILVRTNDEARKMQQVLTKLRVPSVLHSGDDLFASPEAKEMLLLLQGIAAPASISRIKTALLTRFFGLQARAISMLQANEPENAAKVELWLTKFKTYHAIWNRYGFIQMLWAVMRENRVRPRLLAAEYGERSLTNILHLAEILHREAIKQGLNMTGLLAYLFERLAKNPGKNVEHQLRLESDEERVKIVTIHKAKGLEYPVVFCPFAWEGLRTHTRPGCFFHRREPGRKTELIFDAGSPELDNHVQLARQEEMAENLRLLYVALTRAVHRCYLVWGSINTSETSAPAYLLHQKHGAAADSACGSATAMSLMEQIAARLPALSDAEILADLQDLAAAAEGTIRISTGEALPQTCDYDNHAGTLPLGLRKFSAVVPSAWKISSFSSITAGKPALKVSSNTFLDQVLDRDEVPGAQFLSGAQAELEDNTPSIFTFPQGARPGTFLHELLEQADFSCELPVAEHLINEKLQHFGYETLWSPVIADMLKNLGNVPLHAATPGLKLANIPRANCLPEMEFYFPLSRVSPDALRGIFPADHMQDSISEATMLLGRQLDRLNFSPVWGYMRGFIDLVFEFAGKFYLVDWKSNYLGATIANYQREKLADSILAGFYSLQYHIYCLAVHMYLQNRLPRYRYASHFGGVFYIFLRGVRPDLGPDYGIYHDLPDLTTIELLRTKLLAGPTT